MCEPLVPASALGGLGRLALAAALRPLWEDAGPLVDGLAGVEVASWDEHLDAAEACIEAMDEPTRVALLAAHPRLGAPPAELAARSEISLREQGGTVADPVVLARLDRLNEEYEARFGFPFVEWVAGRSRETIVAVLEGRLTRPRDVELAAGCAALIAIARNRFATTIEGPCR